MILECKLAALYSLALGYPSGLFGTVRAQLVSHHMRLGNLCLDNQKKKTVNRPQFFELPRNSTASQESQVTLIHTYSSCELTGDLTDVELNATGRKAEGNFLKGCGRLRVQLGCGTAE